VPRGIIQPQMALTFGNRVGPYEILAAIGAGGMGEVYCARDSKLGRDVALKVLSETFARDPERLARFQREAKLLASLNHPNIAAIYGVEDSGGTPALVMELAEGPTLADRIKQGAVPIEDALRVARQICGALEYAHEKGIIHRDLKPANIKVSVDDTVKILDFGLAKALESGPLSEDMANSPTLSQMATLTGVLLGTAGYMSPEQARSKPVDRRADIWAFGCVLYEMLSGRRAFQGETITDTLAAIMRAEPEWSRLPAATPARVRVLLQRCLQKDPKQRLRDIGDARISLDEVLSGAPDPLLEVRGRSQAPSDLMRLEISLPAKTVLGSTGVFAISPDGRQLAFAAHGADSVARLWVRSLDSLDARPLYGSEAQVFPPFFWSADSRFLAFGAFGKLKKIDVAGGPAQTLCDCPGLVVGGAWSPDGTILFGQAPGGLFRVSQNDGEALPVTMLDPSRKETWHVQPSFLPDGRHFIYLRGSAVSDNAGLYVGSLDSKPEDQDSRLLLSTHVGATYVPPEGAGMGQLLFVRDASLIAQSFDAERLVLTGEPVSLVKQIGSLLTNGFFSASTNGVLVYRTGGRTTQLTWFDQKGKRLGTVGEAAYYVSVAMSPDGSRAAVGRSDLLTARLGLWLMDLTRSTSTRFTSGPSISPVGIWLPDGNRIILGSGLNAKYDLYWKRTSGGKEEELLLASDEAKRPKSCSPDGRFLLYSTTDAETRKNELWLLPLEGEKKPIPFVRTQFNNDEGQFSPDGRWVAYVSDESGRDEVYVRMFSLSPNGTISDDEGTWLISTGGGIEPRWSGDGKTLYYLAPDGTLMAVDVRSEQECRAAVPKALFQTPQHLRGSPLRQSWSVAPDGKRFLFVVRTEQGSAPFNVMLNWQAALKS
jgi:eukaryotic-like serine/threonine-protein kinase